METVNSEHRWISHPIVNSQHENPHGSTNSERGQQPNINIVEPTQLLPPDEVDVFFHHLDGSGNAANWPYASGTRTYRPSMCHQMAAHGATAFQDPQNQASPQGSCSRVFLPTARVPSSQVCRPHFHTPIQWIESKPAPLHCSTPNPASVWCPPFQQSHRPSPMSASGSSSASGTHSSSHLFSFPPTPPKETSLEGGTLTTDFFSYGSDDKRLKGLQYGTPLRADVPPFAGYPQALPQYFGSDLNMPSFGPGLAGLMANRNLTRTRTKSRSNSG